MIGAVPVDARIGTKNSGILVGGDPMKNHDLLLLVAENVEFLISPVKLGGRVVRRSRNFRRRPSVGRIMVEALWREFLVKTTLDFHED